MAIRHRKLGSEAAQDARREEAKDDRQAKDRKADKHHHDKDHKPKPKPGGHGTVTESLKAKSTQSGQDAMNATPGGYPADPANADAVYTTGLGQVVEYNYVRVNGGGADDYAPLQSSYTAPVAGHGQVLTPAAAGDMPSGMENNPT